MEEMSEAPEEVQETPQPEAEAPEQGTPEATEGEPYEKRYNDLRSEFDRRNQEFAQYRDFVERLQSDESSRQDLFRALAEEFGYELPQEDAEEGEPEQFFDPRVDELLQERELDRIEARIDKDFAEIAKSAGRELSEREKNIVVSHALSISGGDPDVKAAYKDLESLRNDWTKDYVSSKSGAPQVPTGSPGEEKVDLSDPKARVAHMAARLGVQT